RGRTLRPRIPSMIHRQVRRDPVQPGTELRLSLIRAARPIDPQEDFLRQLLGDRLIVRHPIHKTNDRTTKLLYQISKCRVVASPGEQHDFSVRHLAQWTRSSPRRNMTWPTIRARNGAGNASIPLRIESYRTHTPFNPFRRRKLRWIRGR